MSLHLDGRLAPEEEKRFQEHLSACPACAGMWQRWQQVDRFFTAPPVAQPSVDLAARVWLRIERRQRRGALLGSTAWMALGLAVLAALYAVLLAARLLLVGTGVAQIAAPWLSVRSAALPLWEMARALCIVLRALLNTPAVAIALLYCLATAATLTAWLRVAIFRPARPSS